MVPLRDLTLDGHGPAYAQIYRSIREAILAGRAPAGIRLPSSRWLADDLAVSRNTVIAAYDQLLSEGYAVSRVGSGTFVAPQLSVGRVPAGRPRRSQIAVPRLTTYGERIAADSQRRVYDGLQTRGAVPIDFMPCVPGVRVLSTEAWTRAAHRQLARDPGRTLAYGDPSGVPELREQVAAYLCRSRGVVCDVDDIAIVAGVAQVLDLCSRLLLREGDAALIEDPHYIGARRAFEIAGARVVGARVDREGIDLDSVPAADLDAIRLAYVTPSHQFPSGAVMSLTRRMALLEWADRVNAFVIEDDYDSEFRYAGRAIEALKSLDRSERVIYVGTFSKVLDPALRLAYVVVPKGLKTALRNAKWMADWASPSFEQKILADFIGVGDFDRHLRRMRTQYGKRRDALLTALSDELGERVRIADSRAGLHVLVEFPTFPRGLGDELVRRCWRDGVAVYPAAPYYLDPPEACQLILGFTLPELSAIPEGARILARAVREAGNPAGRSPSVAHAQ